MRNRGRPPVKEVQLRDGFYIEVCNKGSQKGLRIRRDSRTEMEYAANQYASHKNVVILGEFKNGVPMSAATVL